MIRKKSMDRRTSAVLLGVLLLISWVIFPVFPIIADGFCMDELLVAEFTTYYDEGNENRAKNVKRAAEKINGAVIRANGKFSFNERVGARTTENGYLPAPVIFEHAFTLGVGGGVCQVSTTLYNCALKAGLKVRQAEAHSVKVGYVLPSTDAMVSEWSDLVIENRGKTPVKIAAKSGMGAISVQIYGKKPPFEYALESVVIAEDKEGGTLKSEGYLVSYRRGKRVKRVRIRRDEYVLPPL